MRFWTFLIALSGKVAGRLGIGAPIIVSAASLVIAGISLAVSWSIHSNQGLHYSWGRVSSHVPGNSGGAGALEYLYSRGEDLRWVDLRPTSPAFAADEAEARTGDDVPAVAREVNLSGASLREAWFDRTDFTDAILKDAQQFPLRLESLENMGFQKNFS